MAKLPAPGTRRPTISDIARATGVSKASVSYALNGRSGVSEATRQRVLAVAAEIGWRPNAAARSLSGASAGAVGLAVARDVEVLGEEPYLVRLLAGVESVLAAEGYALLLTVVPDAGTAVEVLRAWWGEGRIDGVLLTDLLVDDPRLALVDELGIPCAGRAGDAYGDGAAVDDLDEGPVTDVVRHLVAAGHTRLARVRGPRQFLHTVRRDGVWEAVTRRELGRAAPVADGDYSGASGVAATARLLAASPPPTAVVYDNDVMAATVLAERAALGVRVPADLAVVAWEDSVLCTLAHPAVSALQRDVVEDGRATARTLLAQLGAGSGAPAVFPRRRFVARASTGAITPPGGP